MEIHPGSLALLFAFGRGDDSTDADRVGVGAECTSNAQCESPDEEIENEASRVDNIPSVDPWDDRKA